MNKLKTTICSLIFLVTMLASAGPVIADGHCDAGFAACIEAADSGAESSACVDGYLACVGYAK